MALTDARIRAAKPGDKVQQLVDGFGLYLEVSPTGRRSWRFRYWLDSKEARLTLGQYPLMSLQEARKERDRLREMVARGVSPNQERKVAKLTRKLVRETTFQAVAEEWLAAKKSTWSVSTHGSISRCLSRNAYPAFGAVPIKSVNPPMVLAVLQAMEKRGAKRYAILLRTCLSRIFRYGVATLRCDSDPAALVTGAITPDETRHTRAVTREELRELWQKLEDYGGHRTTILAIRLLALTFVRTHELRYAEWSEVSEDFTLWSIPPERMKIKSFGRRHHLVPLATQAQAVMCELHAITGSSPLLFPSAINRRRVLGEGTINAAIQGLGFSTGQITGHTFRSTASTWLYDQGYYGDMIELQLAHIDRNRTRRAYRHSEWLEERREMMQAYADWLFG